MKTAGRNDPCPCGSGRKYKDCCAPAADSRFATVASSSTRDSAIGKLLAFAFQPAFDSDHSVAEVVFWGNLIRDGAADELLWLLNSEDANIKYNAWFLFDWELDGSGTVADLFLDEPQVQLSELERAFLRRLANAHLRLYEVESVDRGHGLRLVDLWTGTRLFVIERTASQQMVNWDLLGARVAPDGLGGNVFEGGLYLYPADAKEDILGHFRRLFKRHHRKFPLDDAGAFFRKHGAVFHHLWMDLVAFPEPPQIITPEGDPLMFCRSVFDTERTDSVREAVSAQPSIRAVDDARFSWRETADDGERELGTWSFENNRVIFETTSQERAARGRAWIESLVGDAVRFRATALETLEQTLEEVRKQPPRQRRDEHEDEPVEDSSAVQQLFDRHYRTWLDRPVPALGNRTPRAAARTKLWRSRVIDLLKQLENRTERAALSGRPPYDFGWLWEELGIQRAEH